MVDGTLYVPADGPLPQAARPQFVPAKCQTDGPFELGGDWLGVLGRHRPRYDGELRPAVPA